MASISPESDELSQLLFGRSVTAIADMRVIGIDAENFTEKELFKFLKDGIMPKITEEQPPVSKPLAKGGSY